MSFLRYIGRVKYRAMRLSGYVTIFNTVLLVVNFGWQWWYLFAALGIIVGYWFEKEYAIPAEQDVGFGSNAEWQEFKKDWNNFRAGR